MAKKKHTTIMNKRIRKGEKMTLGRGWKLAHEAGRKRAFRATLLKTVNAGNIRIAIFSVPKNP